MRNIDTSAAESRPSDTISLRDLLTPLFRHRLFLAISFVVLFGSAAIALLLRGAKYESHMQVLVNRQRVDPIVSSQATPNNGAAVNPVTEEEINSEAELLRSQDVLQKVVELNGLQTTLATGALHWMARHSSEAARTQSAEVRLAKDLDIKTIPKSNVLDVSYTSSNPRLAHDVLQSLGTLYIEKHVALYSAPGSYKIFDAETRRYQQAINDAEAQLHALALSGGMAAPDLEKEGVAQQVADSIGSLHAAEESVAAADNRLANDKERLKVTNARTDSTKSTTPPTILLQQLGGDLLKAQTKRAQLAAKYLDGYPLLVEATEEVTIAQDAFNRAQKTEYLSESSDRDPTYEYLRQDIAKTEADLAAQRGTVVAARRSIASMQQQMVDLDAASLKRSDLLREMKANEDNYLLYLGKREQARASEVLDRMRIANVAIAVPPSAPVLPVNGTLTPLLEALGLTLALSLALTYLVAYFDPSFREPEDVREQLQVPFVIAVSKKAA